MAVDEDVEEAARDLMELNDDGHRARKRKQSMLHELDYLVYLYMCGQCTCSVLVCFRSHFNAQSAHV